MKSKNIKILSFISLIFMTLIILGGVSAVSSDENQTITDTPVISTDSNVQEDSNTISDNKQLIKEDVQVKSATKNVDNYADLKTEIDNMASSTDDEDIINLQTGTYDITESITVGQSTTGATILTINGNGATINGADTYQFITVKEGFTLNLNDLIITNTQAEIGSAIINYGTLNINNVNFTDNTATKSGSNLAAGAAIYSEGTTTITDSEFIGNTITGGVNGDDGAAIHTTGALYVYNTKFDSNIGEYTDSSSSSNGANGGAIAVIGSTSDFIVNNCTFTNNKGRHGGAILLYDSQGRNQGNKVINASKFTANQAIYGGAIEMYNDLIIENSTFEENVAYGIGSDNRKPLGGAIIVNDMVDSGNPGSLTVKNTTFTRNTVPQSSVSGATNYGYGGAIYNSGPTTTIENCTFTENEAISGSAIYDPSSKKTNTLTITDSSFDNNAATTIYTNYVTSTITDTNITTSEKSIENYLNHNKPVLENVLINNLKVEGYETGGFKVSVNNYQELVDMIDCINNDYGSSTMINIYLEGDDEYIETEPLLLENNTCSVRIKSEPSRTINANGLQFITVNEGKTLYLGNLTIINAQADNGAAIINHGTAYITSCTFEDNQALYNGGAIYSDGTKLTVSSSNFTNNQVTTTENATKYDYGGGAICVLGALDVRSSNFISNIAAHNDVEPKGDGGVAGAILILNNTNTISITSSNFTKNTARHGGAITLNNNGAENTKKVTINKNNFIENDALYGGAIDTFQAVNITNNNFTGNIISGQGSGNRVPMGAAICVNQGETEYTAMIINNNFVENQAQDNGCAGAVFTMPDTTVTSANNLYQANTASDTGAFYNQGKATFTNDTFIANEGTIYTGVFSQFGDELTINNCTFTENEGNGYGDIVYAGEDAADVIITDSVFNTINEDYELIVPSTKIIATNNTVNNIHLDEGLIIKKDVELTVADVTVTVGQPATLTIALTDEDEADVAFGFITITDSHDDTVAEFDITEDELTYTTTINIVDQSVYTITFNNNKKYNEKVVTATITTEAIATEEPVIVVKVNDEESQNAYRGDNIVVEVTTSTTDGTLIKTGSVSLIKEDETIIGEADVDTQTGIATITIPSDNVETVFFTAVFTSDIYETSENQEGYVEIEVIDISAKVEDATAYINKEATLTAEFTDSEEVPEGLEVNFLLDGEIIATGTVDEQGYVTAEYTFTQTGDYEVSVEADELPLKYNNIGFESGTITVTTIPAQMYELIDDETYYVNSEVEVIIMIEVTDEDIDDEISEGTIIVKDSNGNEVANEAVDSGMILFNIDSLAAGDNVFTVEYVSAGSYDAQSITFTINALKLDATITVDEINTLQIGETVTITANVESDEGTVEDGQVTFTDKEGNIIAQVDVEDGIATFEYQTNKTGSVKVIATYSDSETYTDCETSFIIKTVKATTTVTVDSVDAIVGNTINLTARVTSSFEGVTISEGKVVFKINGKTVKDENGKVIYARVTDGIATIEDYVIPDTWMDKDINISAVYSGSTNYNSSRGYTTDVVISTGVASLEITSNNTFTKDAEKTFTVSVKDGNKAITDGKIVFKINGKTLKDANGKVIYTNVVDGIATLTFNINSTYYKTSSWLLKAVFVSNEYDRVETTQQLALA